MISAPYVVVVMGLPGSGKTYFARELAGVLSAVHLSSDQIRKKKGLLGKYSLQDKLLVYRQLVAEVDYCLQDQKVVVIDATFHRQLFRNIIEKLVRSENIALFYLRIVAEEDTIEERVKKKRPDSQADFKVYQQLRQEFEPLSLPFLELNSSQQSLEIMIEKAKEYLSSERPSI